MFVWKSQKLREFVGSDKCVLLWDLSNGEMVGKLKGHTDAIHSVTFSRESSVIASGKRLEKPSQIWNIIIVYLFLSRGSWQHSSRLEFLQSTWRPSWGRLRTWSVRTSHSVLVAVQPPLSLCLSFQFWKHFLRTRMFSNEKNSSPKSAFFSKKSVNCEWTLWQLIQEAKKSIYQNIVLFTAWLTERSLALDVFHLLWEESGLFAKADICCLVK